MRNKTAKEIPPAQKARQAHKEDLRALTRENAELQARIKELELLVRQQDIEADQYIEYCRFRAIEADELRLQWRLLMPVARHADTWHVLEDRIRSRYAAELDEGRDVDFPILAGDVFFES